MTKRDAEILAFLRENTLPIGSQPLGVATSYSDYDFAYSALEGNSLVTDIKRAFPELEIVRANSYAKNFAHSHHTFRLSTDVKVDLLSLTPVKYTNIELAMKCLLSLPKKLLADKKYRCQYFQAFLYGTLPNLPKYLTTPLSNEHPELFI